MDVESDAAMDSSMEHLANENSSVRRTYTLPWIRYINGVLVLLFAELITIWVLWFAVGDSKFFIDQITNYSFLGSVFDVAVVTTSKLITLIPIVFSLLLFLASLYSFTAMRNIPIIRIKHEFNEQGQELNDKGEPITKDASILRLVKLAKPEYPMLAIASVALMGSTASQVVAPLFFGLVVDAAQRSMEDLNRTVVILVLIYIGGALSGLFRSWLFTLAGQRFVARLRTQLFASIIKQDVAFFDTTRTGELTNRLSSDTQVLQNAVTFVDKGHIGIMLHFCLPTYDISLEP
ncbi:unnamed protein product [Owenia fusiformis]|uniref:ABC transmembrane type-1 domain-containing protein n=1 Tax=Owenia fusiformis TaxID=6347 RepID=A0A8S4Q856_OWEFU|nr:unnamed protein product [Owenia fusiformis]